MYKRDSLGWVGGWVGGWMGGGGMDGNLNMTEAIAVPRHHIGDR